MNQDGLLIKSKGAQEIKAVLDDATKLVEKINWLFKDKNPIASCLAIQTAGRTAFETFPNQWQAAKELAKVLAEQQLAAEKKPEIIV